MNHEEATVVQFPVTVALECPKCGAVGQGSCHCGVPYVPAGERAAKDIAENAGLSDRAIAEKIGVSDKTIAKARKASTAEQSAVEMRTGKDGKRRKVPARKPRPGSCDDPQYPEEIMKRGQTDDELKRVQFLYCAYEASDRATIARKIMKDAANGIITDEWVKDARKAGHLWSRLANDLCKRTDHLDISLEASWQRSVVRCAKNAVWGTAWFDARGKFAVTNEMIARARKAAEVWKEIADKLEQQRGQQS